MSSTFCSTGDFLDRLEYPFIELDETITIHSQIVFNVPHTSFPTNFFGTMQHGPFKRLLFLLAQTLSENYLFSTGEPRIFIRIENLISEKNQTDVIGLRFWFDCSDPDFNWGEAFLTAIDIIKKKKQLERNDFQKKRGQIEEVSDTHIWDELSNIDNIFKLIYSLYDSSFKKDQDLIHKPENSLKNESSILNPVKFFTAEKAMKLWCDWVKPEQRNLKTYYNINENQSASPDTYKNKVYDPRCFCRLRPQYFNPTDLLITPVQFKYKIDYFDLLDQLDDANNRKDLAEQLDKKDTSPNANLEARNRVSTPSSRLNIRICETRVLEVTDAISRFKTMINIPASSKRLLGGESFMDIFKEKNQFLVLREINEKKVEDIKKKFEPNTKAYNEALESFRTIALDEFWNVFLNAPNLTKPVLLARAWFSKLAGDKKWFETNMVCDNLTAFGSYWAKIADELNNVSSVETNNKIVVLALIIMQCSLRYSFVLRPNLVLSGEGAAGKSYIMDILENVCFPGAIVCVTNITAQAYNTDTDASDGFVIMHEAAGYIFGINRDGKSGGNADPGWKARLTKTFSTVLYFDNSTGVRTLRTCVSRNMNGFALLSNEKLPDDNEAIMTRFLNCKMTKKTRPGNRGDNYINRLSEVDDIENNANIIHISRLIHFFILIIEKAIEAGALAADVDLNTPKIFSQLVFQDLTNSGTPSPAIRHKQMFLDITRILCIHNAVVMEYGSELAINKREIKEGEYSVFNIQSLKGIIKWLCASQEQSVFAMTLMEDVFAPSYKRDVSYTMAHYIMNWGSDKPVTWKMNQDGTNDYRYIALPLGFVNLTQLASQIQAHMNIKLAVNEIVTCLLNMESEVIKSPSYMLVDKPIRSEQKQTKMEIDDLMDDNFEDIVLKPNQESFKLSKDNKKDESILNQLSNMDNLTSTNRSLINELRELTIDENEAEERLKKEILQLENQQKELETQIKEEPLSRKRRLNDIPLLKPPIVDIKKKQSISQKIIKDVNSKIEQIPPIIIEEIPNQRKKNIYLAVSMFFNYDPNENPLKKSIVTVLSSICKTPVTYITGFHPVALSKNIPEGKKLLDKQQDIFYNLFDIINVKPNGQTKAIVIENFYAKLPTSIKFLYSTEQSQVLKRKIHALGKIAGTQLDTDGLDTPHFAAHVVKTACSEPYGLHNIANPMNTAKAIINIRQNNKRFAYLNDEQARVKNYPEDCINDYYAFEKKQDELRIAETQGKILPGHAYTGALVLNKEDLKPLFGGEEEIDDDPYIDFLAAFKDTYYPDEKKRKHS